MRRELIIPNQAPSRCGLHKANIGYFDEQGYPTDALIEYLLNLANSNFEDWRKTHPQNSYGEFKLTFKKLQNSNGPLFDFKKLDDISRNVIARLSAEELYRQVIVWAEKYDELFSALLKNNFFYIKKILSIERDMPNRRKDIQKLSDIKHEIYYFFDEHFQLTPSEVAEQLSTITSDKVKKIVREFIDTYRSEDSKDEWFEKIKQIARNHGFAENNVEFKKNPKEFKGSVADVAKIFRVLLTGRTQTPDLHAIMQTMGHERVLKRLSSI